MVNHGLISSSFSSPHDTRLSFTQRASKRVAASTRFAFVLSVLAVLTLTSACGLFNQSKQDSSETKLTDLTMLTPPPPKPTSLTSEAENILKAAEQTVIEARVKRSLWTSANEHLLKARLAAKIFDSVATTQHAREVISLCELSNKQLSDSPAVWQ
jgi:hypothetical protein